MNTSLDLDFDDGSMLNSDAKYYYYFDVVIRESIIKRVLPFIGIDNRCLEIGAYKGYMTRLLSKHFKSIDIVEPLLDFNGYYKQISSVQSIFNVPLENASLGSYNVIFLINTLEHMDDRVAALSKIRSHLSSSGVFVCAVPNASSLSRQIALNMGILADLTEILPSERQMGHKVTYTAEALKSDCRLAGFSVIWEGGDLVKPMSNSQLDRCMSAEIVSRAYMEGLYRLGETFPELCASCILVLSK